MLVLVCIESAPFSRRFRQLQPANRVLVGVVKAADGDGDVCSNSQGLGAYKTKNTLPLLKAAIVDFKEGKDFASSLLGLAFNLNILLFITRQPFAVATIMSAAVVDVDITKLIYANARASIL